MALTKRQMNSLIKKNPDFAQLVDVHGVPIKVKDCRTNGQPGDICMAANCVNGRQLVMKCDHSNGCTVYETIPC